MENTAIEGPMLRKDGPSHPTADSLRHEKKKEIFVSQPEEENSGESKSYITPRPTTNTFQFLRSADHVSFPGSFDTFFPTNLGGTIPGPIRSNKSPRRPGDFYGPAPPLNLPFSALRRVNKFVTEALMVE